MAIFNLRTAGALVLSGSALLTTPYAYAQQAEATSDAKDGDGLNGLRSELAAYRQQVEAQSRQLKEQETALHKLQLELRRQTAALNALEKRSRPETKTTQPQPVERSVTPTAQSTPPVQLAEAAPQPERKPNDSHPVGEAPAEAPRPQVQAISDLGGVLTPRGMLALEPSIEFDHTSTNQLIFRGISIVQGLLVGVIDASDIRGDTTLASLTARYGVTSRFELEAKIPYLYRRNQEIDIPSTSNAHPIQSSTSGNGVGDIEAAVHYQFNSGHDNWPIFIGNLRYKSDTGKGPFDIGYDLTTGAQKTLPVGSGFMAIEPSLTMIYATDPVVMFASIEYDHSFAKTVNKTLSDTCGAQNNQPCVIGDVTPGEAFGATLGMTIALNEMTSLTLGYQHYYIGGTRIVVGGSETRSSDTQVGSLIVGGSYQVDANVGINFTTQIGATRDAPDVRVMLRVPIATHLFE